jgi:beta-lactamase class A
MISYSDNEAAHLLARLLGSDRLARVSEETGISRRGDNLPTAVISVRDYSAIFRLLYNATYLGREMSEKALQLLGRTTFSYGLTAQLPDSVRVAHKFGEHGVGAEGSPEKQLHDCGVVYAPGSPYLLCIMTQGRDFTELARIISGISRLAYNAVTEPRR